MPVVVRQLTPADIAIMEAMMTMFGRAFEDVATYTDARPIPVDETNGREP